MPKVHSAPKALRRISAPLGVRPLARNHIPRGQPKPVSRRSRAKAAAQASAADTKPTLRKATMSLFRSIWGALVVMCTATTMASIPASAQQQQQQQPQGQKPNILFIMGDDIGWMQPGIYHRGLMVGETPNIDRIGNEGAIFMDYVAMQSCTSGRNAFFTGMCPLRAGTSPPQRPCSPACLRPGAPARAKFRLDRWHTRGQ